MGYRILERKTDDGEPTEVWHICVNRDGEWVQAVDEDFDTYDAAKERAADLGIEIEE